MMCVTETNEPLGSAETATLVITGGIDTVVCPFASVVEMNTGEESVDSGCTVTVLVAVGDAATVCVRVPGADGERATEDPCEAPAPPAL